MAISDSDAVLMNAEKKRQKSLQCNSKISTKLFRALKDAVSAVADSKRSCAVDDLNCHTQPSQVVALTSRCQMWLHVAYGVYLVMLLILLNSICLLYTLYLNKTRVPVSRTYNICLSHHVLTSNYFSFVSLINAPNLLNCISLAYTLYM